MTKKFKLNDTIIVTFYNKSIPEKPIKIDPNEVRFQASGCCFMPDHNDFYICEINQIQEVTEINGYYDCDDCCCDGCCNGEYVTYTKKYKLYRTNKSNSNMFRDYELKKYSVKLHKELCKKYDLKYIKYRK
jgi:hypothetical protein